MSYLSKLNNASLRFINAFPRTIVNIGMLIHIVMTPVASRRGNPTKNTICLGHNS